MQTIKLYLLVLKTYVIRKKIIFGWTILTIAFLLFLIFSLKDILFTKTVTEGIIGTVQERDLPEQVTNLMSQSLVIVDKKGLPKPNLASGWEVMEDSKVYVFKLKDGLTWADGTKVRSQDIDITIPDVTVEYPDDNTIKFKITDSFSPFPTLLEKPVLKKGTLIGIGPYSISKIKKDGIFIKRLTLKSKDKNLPQVVINFYPNEKIAKNALILGEVQSLLGISDLSGLNEPNLKVFSWVNYEQIVTVFFNTKDAILSDENFRLALSFASPSIKGEIEAKTSLSPNSWAFNPQVKDYLDNTDQAKLAWNKVKNGKDAQITLTVTSSLKNVGEQVVQSWKALGVNAVLRVESGIPQNFQTLLITQNIPADPDQYSLWHSTQGVSNISKYSSPRVDKDLEDGRKLSDMETRKTRYQDFQKVLLDHAPAAFLYFPKYNVVSMKKVENDLNTVLKIQLSHME